MNEIMIATIPTVLIALVTFLLTRRRYIVDVNKAKSEVNGNELDNVEKAVKIWRDLTEDITERMNKDFADLRTENEYAKTEMAQLKRENHSLRHQMVNMKRALRITRLENEELTRQLKLFNDRMSTEDKTNIVGYKRDLTF